MRILSIIQMRKRAFSGIIVLAGLMGYSLLTNVAFMTAEPSPFQLQPVWELRARAVADSCGYRFRSGSENGMGICWDLDRKWISVSHPESDSDSIARKIWT